MNVNFDERLIPSRSVLVALALSGPMVLLAALPFGLELSITLGLVVPAVLIVIAVSLSPRIQVTDSLRIGKFNLPLEIISFAEGFEGEAARLQRGPSLDARARLAIRGDIDQVVKIHLNDPLDPTPYILVSTRKPGELVSALGANRT
jgi:hypothetical protein